MGAWKLISGICFMTIAGCENNRFKSSAGRRRIKEGKRKQKQKTPFSQKRVFFPLLIKKYNYWISSSSLSSSFFVLFCKWNSGVTVTTKPKKERPLLLLFYLFIFAYS